MTPIEERAQNVVHFLSVYLAARDKAVQASESLETTQKILWGQTDTAARFLATSLVALVTEAQRKVDE